MSARDILVSAMSNNREQTMDSHYLPEPYRIRVIEPVKRTTEREREQALMKAGYNPFLLDSDKVFIDLLTDSGTGAVTQDMQSAMLRGDEAYSGSRSYRTLSQAVKNIFGYQFTIPTHQGRGAEQLYVPTLINKRERERGLERDKMAAFSNYFFDTTQGHTQHNNCRVMNVPSPDAFNTKIKSDFKGNFNLKALAAGIEEIGAKNVPYIVSTITCNSAGGQPVSLANLKAVYELAQSHDIPVVMDCARFAENAYFVKQREEGYAEWSIQEITSEAFKYADIFSMSAKKDAMVPIGGLLAFKDDSLLDVQLECKTLCVLLEGFPTYGGLEGGAMERLAVGLYDGMEEDWLASRLQQIEYLVNGLEALGVRCQQAGGHAAFVDAGALLPHISPDQFPGHALSCELYKVAGIRADESLHRFNTIKNRSKKKLADKYWTTQMQPFVYMAYPLYDWKTQDIWIANYRFNWDYNRIYDLMHKAGVSLAQQRLCQPFGDEQRKGLWLYQILEPNIWQKLVARVEGCNFGARYSKNQGRILGYYRFDLPPGLSYRQYSKYLLKTMPPHIEQHYRERIFKFLQWWRKNGPQKGVTFIPDYAESKLESRKQVPSWRRICKVLIKNDYWCRGLSFGYNKTLAKRYHALYGEESNANGK